MERDINDSDNTEDGEPVDVTDVDGDIGGSSLVITFISTDLGRINLQNLITLDSLASDLSKMYGNYSNPDLSIHIS